MADDTKNLTDLKAWLIAKVVETMPDEIKAQGGCTSPEGIEAAVDIASTLGHKIIMQLFLLLISQPNANHEVLMKFPSLNSGIEEMRQGKHPTMRREEGESLKDGTPDAGAFMQRPAKA